MDKDTADALADIKTLLGGMAGAFDAVQTRFDAVDARLDTVQAELTAVHGLARQNARVATETRNRLEILMDAFAAHRREYIDAHPHDEG